MERLYKGLEIIKNNFHTSNQQRRKINYWFLPNGISLIPFLCKVAYNLTPGYRVHTSPICLHFVLI